MNSLTHSLAIIIFVIAPLVSIVGLPAFLAAVFLGALIVGLAIIRDVLDAIENWPDVESP